MTYEVAGAICDNEYLAALAIVEAYMSGNNDTETVAGLDIDEIYTEITNDADWEFEAKVIGKITEDGQEAYHDVRPSDKNLRCMIAYIIQEARDRAEGNI